MVSLWIWEVRNAQITQNNKFAISVQHLKENVKLMDEVDFCLQINGRFLQIYAIILGVCGHIIQNNKFPISLQYLNKEGSDEVDFLNADKHESFL